MPHHAGQSSPGAAWLVLAGILGFLAVAFGAVGAHALKPSLSPEAQGWFRTAWEYQILHTLALTFSAALTIQYPEISGFRRASAAFTLGIFLFSGSLYAVSLGAPHLLVHITPIGGFSLMAGWLFLSVGALSLRKALRVRYDGQS